MRTSGLPRDAEERGKSVHRDRKGQGTPSTRPSSQPARALAAGPDCIYQAALPSGRWGGLCGFPGARAAPSKLGDFSYEIIDTKLKRSPDPKHVLQLALYSDLLADVQGIAPEHIHIVLGDNRRVSRCGSPTMRPMPGICGGRLEDFIASPRPTRPEPVAGLRAVPLARALRTKSGIRTDSLCLVAGIRKDQRHKLEAAGATTMTDLAATHFESPQAGRRDARQASQPSAVAAPHGAPEVHPHFELRPLQPGKGVDTTAASPPEATSSSTWRAIR